MKNLVIILIAFCALATLSFTFVVKSNQGQSDNSKGKQIESSIGGLPSEEIQ